MNNHSDSGYIRIDLPESVTDFIAAMQYSLRYKILEIQLLERYEERKIHSFFDAANLQKSIKDLKKKMDQHLGVSDADFLQIEEIILYNMTIFETPIQDANSDEVNIEPVPRPKISFEEWQKTLQRKYKEIRQACEINFPGIWNSIEFELAVLRILNIKGCTLPFGGIVLGAPSSSKTLGIELFRDHGNVYYTDSFSAKAFVTHNTNVKKEELYEIDLLPKIKNKCLLAPELSPIFSKKDDDLVEILGILTRILDGHGYQSDSGAHGRRGYSGEHMFVLIGAAVDIPYKVHKQLATLGPKLYFIRIPRSKKNDGDYLEMLQRNDFNKKREELGILIKEYLDWFINTCPIEPDENNLIKLSFSDESNMDPYILSIIVKLGKLLAHLRGAVKTWNTEKTQGSNYGYSTPTIEEPDRAMTQLLNLAKGHALSQGRNFLTLDDIPILIKVVLSTASIERVMIFDLLLSNGGTLTTSQISNGLKISKNTALKTMAQLKVLGLVSGDMVDIEDEEYIGEIGYSNDNTPKSITLEKDFEWFLSEEFGNLREGFIPEGKSKYDKNSEESVKKNNPQATKEKLISIEQGGESQEVSDDSNNLGNVVTSFLETTRNFSKTKERCKEKSPPPTLKKYDDGEDIDFDYLKKIALEEFKQLETKNSEYEIDYPLVNHLKLRNKVLQNPILVTMKVDNKGVDRVIFDLLRDGTISKTREGLYYRPIRDDNAAATAAAA